MYPIFVSTGCYSPEKFASPKVGRWCLSRVASIIVIGGQCSALSSILRMRTLTWASHIRATKRLFFSLLLFDIFHSRYSCLCFLFDLFYKIIPSKIMWTFLECAAIWNKIERSTMLNLSVWIWIRCFVAVETFTTVTWLRTTWWDKKIKRDQ